MRYVSYISAVLLCAIEASALNKEWYWEDFREFVTEPHIRSYKAEVRERVDDSSALESGYIFHAPFPRKHRAEIGPHIIDQNGDLVWWGNDSTKSRAQTFHVCDYLGTTGSHLCWAETTHNGRYRVQGKNRVLDNTYSQVTADYQASFPLENPNPHEFNLLPGGETFIQTVYQHRPRDLRPYAGPENGVVLDGCFQEVDVNSGKAFFTWCGLDHLPVWHTQVFLNVEENNANFTGEPFGSGTIDSPWDYLHMNAVDKTPEGDYLVSARHLDTVLKIAGNDNVHGVQPGSILWRLGGRGNEFAALDITDLSRQHHVRHIRTTATETTFSVFNNQWQVRGTGPHVTNAQIVTINNATMSVTSSLKFYQPEGLQSLAQGSMQILPNGNVFVGWGTLPQVSEFSADGTLLHHMHLDHYFDERETRNMQNYRSFKFQWTGYPRQPPKVVVYAQTCTTGATAPLTAYVSWNGATEVRAWRFWRSTLGGAGPWLPSGTFARTGFETSAVLRSVFGGAGGVAPFSHRVRVEALNSRGRVLGTAEADTFVPSEEIKEDCDEDLCWWPDFFEYDASLSCAGACEAGWDRDLLGLAAVVVAGLGAMGVGVRWIVRRRSHRWRVGGIGQYEYVKLRSVVHWQEKRRGGSLYGGLLDPL